MDLKKKIKEKETLLKEVQVKLQNLERERNKLMQEGLELQGGLKTLQELDE